MCDVIIDAREFASRVSLFVAAMTGGRPLDADERAMLKTLATRGRPEQGAVRLPVPWLEERARLLAEAPVACLPPGTSWGWKEPNTHIVLPQLLRELPGLRYVHVVRNGLDMAFSRNQSQLAFWGERWLGRQVRPGPRDALTYWCMVHRRVQEIGDAMGSRFLWLDYDALCADPAEGFAILADFLGLPVTDTEPLLPLVRPQPTTGRHREHPLSIFDPADLDYLSGIGHLQQAA